MKKFFKTMILVTTIGLLFGSCSKEKDGLAGTTWVATIGTMSMTLSFKSETNVTFTVVNGGQSGTTSGTYTYTPPNITLDIVFDNGDILAISGTVSGNAMLLDMFDYTITFVKK
jgi:hypothetical protein